MLASLHFASLDKSRLESEFAKSGEKQVENEFAKRGGEIGYGSSRAYILRPWGNLSNSQFGERKTRMDSSGWQQVGEKGPL